MLKHFNKSLLFLFQIIILCSGDLPAQMITGIWNGRINKKKVELKIIQKGDSLMGTSYYYESSTNYRRYSIKGYFDPNTNAAVWWDDQLIEDKTRKSILSSPGKIPYLSSADFNCPGSDKMYLEGTAALKNERDEVKGPVNLEKTNNSQFNDEWDFIIDNYTAGANDPYIIDSVSSITSSPLPTTVETVQTKKEERAIPDKQIIESKPEVKITEPVKPISEEKKKEPILAIEEKFIKREKIIAVEIPVSGDSIELRFYDNAEIDGDSISLFLNNKMIFQHIRLKASAYTIKIPVNELLQTNELVMVAENLGSIPPNTSYMLAIVDNKRYEAMLKSTEETSAVIKLVKK